MMSFDPLIRSLLDSVSQPPASNNLGIVLSEFMIGTMAWALDSELIAVERMLLQSLGMQLRKNLQIRM